MKTLIMTLIAIPLTLTPIRAAFRVIELQAKHFSRVEQAIQEAQSASMIETIKSYREGK